jgi:cell wall-associated NlpC family hydrolase
LLSARTLPRALMRILFIAGTAAGLVLPATLLPATSARAKEPSLDEIKQRIQTASTALEQVIEGYNTLNAQLTSSRAAATAANARLGPLQRDYEAAVAEVGDLAVDAYKAGQFGTISALLDSGSSGGLLTRVSALDQVARARQSTVGALTGRREALRAEKARLDALVATQTSQQKALAARKAKIEKDLDALYELREQAYGAATESPSTSTSTVTATAPNVSGKAGIAVKFVYAALGIPYVWAADGPDGYDCSGLTLAAWRAAGVTLTHAASVQYEETARISRSQLQPGDLVFYSDLGHVALYVGSGKVIHAPTAGEVVKISSVDMMTPYGYGRVRA